MTIAILQLAGGLAALYVGAEALIRGSSALALRIGMSPLIVGITVVAFGTSSPELIVSLRAAVAGTAGLAIGNVIGSNICNIALILGLVSLIRPISVHAQLVRIDVPVMIGASLLLVGFFWDQTLSRLEGGVLVGMLVVYLGYNIWHTQQSRKLVDRATEASESLPRTNPMRSIVFVAVGLGLLAFGADTFVQGATLMAMRFSVPDAIIGLTIVALGTSLPELATSLVASVKGEGDLSIGNVVGSNIFNILAILGITSMIIPLQSADIDRVDLTVMTGVALCMLPVVRTGHEISRWEGGFLLAVYIGYTVYLIK